MCHYSLLSQRKNASVHYCVDCKTYTITFNNLVLSFNHVGFDTFKAGLEECYEECAASCLNCHRRDIFFNTRLEGVQMLFSINEVGALLSVMQEASFEVIYAMGD